MASDPKPGPLVVPPQLDPVTSAIEHCELMIEDGIADLEAIRAGGHALRPSLLGDDWDEAYAQGRKDACRVILLCLRDREHVTSDDVRRTRVRPADASTRGNPSK